jgi:hypothetical protein
MGYADGQLATGERIIRTERQHWVFPLLVAGRWVAIALVVGVVGAFLSLWVQGSGNGGVVDSFLSLIHNLVFLVTFAALAFAVVGLIWSTIQWRSQEYVLTDRRVMHLHGVVNKQTSDSSLENLTDVQISIPWLGRMLGFGHLILMTPSEAGIESLRCLKDPVEFKRAMLDAKQERLLEINTPRMPAPPLRTPTDARPQPSAAMAPVAASMASAPTPAVPAQPVVAPPVAPPPVPQAPAPTAESPSSGASAEDVGHALETLAELRDKGAITPEDYEAKKAELLSRI